MYLLYKPSVSVSLIFPFAEQKDQIMYLYLLNILFIKVYVMVMFQDQSAPYVLSDISSAC